MKCENCGQEMNDNEMKCTVCGTEVYEPVTPESEIQAVEPTSTEICNETPEIHNEIIEMPNEIPIQNEGPWNVMPEEPVVPEDSNATKPAFSSIVKKYWSFAALAVAAIICIVILVQYNQLNEKYKEEQKALQDAVAENASLESANQTLTDSNAEFEQTIATLEAKVDELENGAATQLVAIKNAFDAGKWVETIDLTKVLHEKHNGSAEDKEAQGLAQQSQAKLDEAAAAEAAKQAQGYETGITYDQLSRTPDDFKGEKVKFWGKVIQVIEGSGTVQIRLAVDENYDTILLGEYSSSIVSQRVLEDDYITIYGESEGTISYQSTMGGTITIPGVSIEKIE